MQERMEKDHDCVMSIDDTRKTWFLKVRVVRLWRTYDPAEPLTVRSIDMVLTDRYVSNVLFKILISVDMVSICLLSIFPILLLTGP
jgi:hypothetical protein